MLDELRRLLRRITSMGTRQADDRELDDELASHLALAEADLIASGVAAEDARRQARIRLGSLDAAREAQRDSRGLPIIDALRNDVRFASRLFRRDLGFALISVLILAIAIGANTAVYSVVRALLLDGPPFENPDRLVWIANDIPGAPAAGGLSLITTRAVIWREWQQRTTSFEGIAAYDAFFAYSSRKLTGRGDATRLVGVHASQNFLDVLGVTPQLGRTFTDAEMQREGPRAVLLGDGFWRRRFAGDAAIVGRAIAIDGQPVTVVGVLPRGFDFSSTFAPGTRVDIITPLVFEEVRNWGNTLAVVGRMKPGVTVAQAQHDLELANAGVKRDYPDMVGYGARAVAFSDYLHGGMRRSLVLLWGAVFAVLLVACANLSTLILTKSTGREREFAVRVALGAGRGRLVRQLLVESVILASLGAALGTAGAWIILDTVASADRLAIPLLNRAALDLRVLAFTSVLTAGTALAIGLLPALRMTRGDVHESLKASARGSQVPAQRRLVSALVITEIALACALLVLAAVLTRSLLNVLDVDLGFTPQGAVAVNIDPPPGRYEKQSQQMEYFAGAVRAVASVPGVVAAGVTDTLPLDRNRSWEISPKRVVVAPDEGRVALVSRVGPGVIHAMGMTLLAGRDVDASDREGSPAVVVVNERLARSFYGDDSAVGRILTVGSVDSRIVGVVGDVRHGSLEADDGFQVYLPMAQRGLSSVDLIVRTTRDPATITGDLRQTLTRFDPTLPVDQIRPVSYLVDRALSPRRFVTSLLAGFAAVALVLASLGIYGVIAASVVSRTREIGVRLALGARPGLVGRQLLAETARLTAVGITAGVVCALGASSLLSSLVYGVSATDVLSFAAAPSALLAVALLAGLLPALRAARTNPITALRVE